MLHFIAVRHTGRDLQWHEIWNFSAIDSDLLFFVSINRKSFIKVFQWRFYFLYWFLRRSSLERVLARQSDPRRALRIRDQAAQVRTRSPHHLVRIKSHQVSSNTVLCRTVVTSIVVRFWPRVSIVVRFLRQIISDYFLKKFRYLSKYLINPIVFSFKLSTVLVANHGQKVFDEFIIELWKKLWNIVIFRIWPGSA